MPLIETRGAGSAQGFGEFAQSAAVNYIEDVFSTYLYTGNGSTQTITNNIDLSGKGGLVWVKNRAGATTDNVLGDTVRGASKQIFSNRTLAEQNYSPYGISAFGSSGFTVADDGAGNYITNANTVTYASWTFRKQAKFFDVVTWTGDGNASKTISHSLGSVPGCIITKMTSGVNNWQTYHRSLGNTQAVQLNLTNAAGTNSGFWNNTSPTATDFTVGTVENASGETYVAYLFAHDAGGFGLTGSDNVISCGSFTGAAGSGDATINLGYEPQWILWKRTDSSTDGWWAIQDTFRGWTMSSGAPLFPNTSAAESSSPASGYFWIGPTSSTTLNFSSGSGAATYIYIAIRRGPMKVPTSGTSVLGLNKYSATSDYQQITTGNLVDLGWQVLNGDGYKFFTRLIGAGYLNPASTAAVNTSAATKFDYMDGFAPYYAGSVGAFNPREVYGFRRAPGFFDVVCYTGNGIGQTIYHNLGVVPEMMIFKTRTGATRNWGVYVASIGTGKKLWLNATNAVQNDASFVPSTPTASILNQGNADETDEGGNTYVAYLFATLAGVSKVGTYTGSGTTKQIDCGFTGGARFVLIKRTDSTGDWYVYDTARGIVAGNDPYLLLNSTAAEVTNTDYVDTYSAGFELSSTAPAALNANGGTYIFLAIA